MGGFNLPRRTTSGGSGALGSRDNTIITHNIEGKADADALRQIAGAADKGTAAAQQFDREATAKERQEISRNEEIANVAIDENREQQSGHIRKTATKLSNDLKNLAIKLRNDPEGSMNKYMDESSKLLEDASREAAKGVDGIHHERMLQRLQNIVDGERTSFRGYAEAKKAAATKQDKENSVNELSSSISSSARRMLEDGGLAGILGDNTARTDDTLSDATVGKSDSEKRRIVKEFDRATSSNLAINALAELGEAPDEEKDAMATNLKANIDNLPGLTVAEKSRLKDGVDKELDILQRKAVRAIKIEVAHRDAELRELYGRAPSQAAVDGFTANQILKDPANRPKYEAMAAQYKMSSMPSALNEAGSILLDSNLTTEDKRLAIEALNGEGWLSITDQNRHEKELQELEKNPDSKINSNASAIANQINVMLMDQEGQFFNAASKKSMRDKKALLAKYKLTASAYFRANPEATQQDFMDKFGADIRSLNSSVQLDAIRNKLDVSRGKSDRHITSRRSAQAIATKNASTDLRGSFKDVKSVEEAKRRQPKQGE